MHWRMRKDSGMTIIEIVVVIAILGIFMAIAIPTVTKSFRLMSQTKRLTARYPNARRALDRVSDMVQQTYPAALASGASFIGRNGSFEAGGVRIPSDELSFPVLDTKYAHVRSVQKISYRLELNPKEEEAHRGLVQTRSFPEAAPESGIKETIFERVVGLDFSYLDNSLDPPQWVSEWPPTSGTSSELDDSGEAGQRAEPQSTRLPEAVKITIFVPGEISPRPKTFATVVNVPSR